MSSSPPPHSPPPQERARTGLGDLSALAARVAAEQAATIAAIAERYEAALRAGGTLFFAGNGGSAADAQHLAAEYVVRYEPRPRAPLRAVALTTDSSLLTACANDLGFDEVFARQVEALTQPGDILVLHSTSGESPNVVRAAQAAKARGVLVIAFLGKSGGQLKQLADLALVIPSNDTARIQELHLAVEHVICGMVEERMRE